MARAEQVFHLREAEKELGFAQAVRSGNTLYVSGTCAVGLDNEVVAPGDMRGQVEHIYRIITMALEAHGASFETCRQGDDLRQRHRRPARRLADPQNFLRGRGAAGRDLDRSIALHAPRFRHRDRSYRRVAGRMTLVRSQAVTMSSAQIGITCPGRLANLSRTRKIEPREPGLRTTSLQRQATRSNP